MSAEAATRFTTSMEDQMQDLQEEHAPKSEQRKKKKKRSEEAHLKRVEEISDEIGNLQEAIDEHRHRITLLGKERETLEEEEVLQTTALSELEQQMPSFHDADFITPHGQARIARLRPQIDQIGEQLQKITKDLSQNKRSADLEQKKLAEEERALAALEDELQELQSNTEKDHEHEAPFHAEIVELPIPKISPSERERRKQDVAEVIAIQDQRDKWQEELDEIKATTDLSNAQEARQKVLQARLEKITLMQERKEAIELAEQIEQADQNVSTTLQEQIEEQKALRKRLTDEKEAQKQDTKNAKREQERLKQITQQLLMDPTNVDLEEQQKQLTQNRLAMQTRAEEYRDTIQDLTQQIDLGDERILTSKAEREALNKALINANERIIAVTGLLIKKTDVPLPRESEVHTEPVSSERKWEQRETAKSEKKSPRTWGQFGKKFGGGALVGSGLALGSAATAFGLALAIPGRFFKTFFKNLYRFSMDPGTFLSEVGQRFKQKTQDPPQGMGPVRGSLDSIRYFLIGDPLPKDQKRKE
ncbi:hypothetical protein GF380_04800 [Candidatus Uhrbacteria bacterium]|nr:hypothetical protein [Candidatus Uhrbacteria bacterium]MBD3284366.1 hypothetical protein [Candidatus Uhrbacteria bacterium]